MIVAERTIGSPVRDGERLVVRVETDGHIKVGIASGLHFRRTERSERVFAGHKWSCSSVATLSLAR